jgi:hypothetical protein
MLLKLAVAAAATTVGLAVAAAPAGALTQQEIAAYNCTANKAENHLLTYWSDWPPRYSYCETVGQVTACQFIVDDWTHVTVWENCFVY